jgi:arylsulfatase A-like enzyme
VQLPGWLWQGPLFASLRVPDVFQQLNADIGRHPRGHAFFAHLLLPHYPYLFDRRCELRPSMSDWLINRIAATEPFVYNTEQSRAQKYERYAEQTRCVLTLIDALLDDLASRGLLEDATIVINGDHGSRIPVRFPTGRALASGLLTQSDLSDTFSTLYAIHAPGVASGYDEAPRSLVELLNHHVSGEPLSAPGSCRVFLLVENGGGHLTGVEPKFCTP